MNNFLKKKEENNNSIMDIQPNFICSSQNDTAYDRFIDPYFQWIDLIFYAILPFIIMAICSFLIIQAMFASNKRLKKTLHANTSNLVTTLKNNFEQSGTSAREATELVESGLF